LAGAEGIPWECRTEIADELMVIERDTKESGYLYFPWIVAGRGQVQLCSGSLVERPKPYNLPVELARGTLNRLRNQAWGWQSAGMAIPPDFQEALSSAQSAFALAATSQAQPAAAGDYADDAIRQGLEAGEMLAREFTQQVLAVRKAQQVASGTLLGARLQDALDGEAADRFQAACNLAVISPHWPEVEAEEGTYDWTTTDRIVQWCQEHSVRVCMGPLLLMDKHALPDWLFLNDDFDEVQTSVLGFVSAVVNRYRGKVQLWHVAGRMNDDGAFNYSEEQRLRLVVEAVDRVRSLEARTPLVVSFNQPWGESIAHRDQELTPLHFADTLVRGELGLSGVGLEINYGYWPGGTLPRDPLEMSRLIDRWTQLGVPLMVFLSAPSSLVEDPHARHPSRPLPYLRAGGITPAWQNGVVEWLLPLLLAKQPVQAIVWDHWQDNVDHELPAAGLLDHEGKPKPALQTLSDLKREWIG
jgi:hypothetical protein